MTAGRKQNKKIEKINKFHPNSFIKSNPFIEAVKSIDYYGQPIGMNFENK